MRRHLPTIGLIVLALNTGWFVLHAAGMGVAGLLSAHPDRLSRVFVAGAAPANIALAVHMVCGALVTIGAPLQALPPLRRRWPGLHRRWGYALFGLAVLTGLGGLVYIARQGTIGGSWMSVWFAIYGGLLILAAANTVYHAIARDLTRHFEWATRFVILAVGSWIYRMHYAIWFGLTGGAGSTPTFDGPFDKAQVVAFFLPYLLLAELALRLPRGRRRKPLA